MSAWTDREFRLAVFKLLQKEMIPTSGLERKIENTAELKGHSVDELVGVLDDLTTQGWARLSGNVYHILPKNSNVPAHVYLYSLIKDDHVNTKRTIDRYARPRFVLTALGLVLLAVTAVLMLLAQWPRPLVPAYYAGIPLSAFLLCVMASGWIKDKDKSSMEKRLATRLLDAYLLMARDDRGDVNKILKEVSKRFQRQWSRYIWETLHCDRMRLAELGSNLEEIVIPEVPNKERPKNELAEILVRIASLVLDATPESIQRVVADPQPEPSVYGSLPIPEDKPREVAPSISDRLRNWRTIRPLRFLAVLAFLSLAAFGIATLYSSFSGDPIQLSTAEFLGIIIGIPSAAAILDHYLVAPSLGY